jgi:deoxycytidylate deaminase
VITDTNDVIIATGYNGCNRHSIDSEIPHNRLPQTCTLKGDYSHLGIAKEFESNKYPFMIHAEKNAIFSCPDKKSLVGANVFITHYPCPDCLNSMIQVGIGRIFVQDNKVSTFVSDVPKLLYILENMDKDMTDYIIVNTSYNKKEIENESNQ